MKMPAPDDALLARKAEIVRALRRIVPGEGVVSEPADLTPFESDGGFVGPCELLVASGAASR